MKKNSFAFVFIKWPKALRNISGANQKQPDRTLATTHNTQRLIELLLITVQLKSRQLSQVRPITLTSVYFCCTGYRANLPQAWT